MKKYKTIYLVYNQKLYNENNPIAIAYFNDIFEAQRAIDGLSYTPDKENIVIVRVNIPVEYPEIETNLTAEEIDPKDKDKLN